jgi:tRNA-dihydrouridine synthase B
MEVKRGDCSAQENGYDVGMFSIAQVLSGRPFRVGSVGVDGRAFLAPMSGVTDIAMRRIARRFGASLVVSEMVASDSYVKGDDESRLRAEGEGIDPHVVQIAGRDPYWMGEAARMAEASGAAIIDINMGCPAKKVTGGYAGSALMRTPDLAHDLIAATVSAVKIPVTLKMRLGWDETCLNAATLAKRAEGAGVAMVTIHGRTRAQFYTGRADWSAIRAIKDAVKIPVVANGDCASPEDATAMLAESGADAAMIGRAALGRPWLVGQIAASLAGGPVVEPTFAEKRDAALEHLYGLMSQLGVRAGIRHARKHLAAYADHARPPIAGAADQDRRRLVTSDDPREVARLLASFFGEAAPQSEAA